MALRGTWWFGKLTVFSDLISRYGAVIASWKNVESSFAYHYGLTLHDIWTMSWRRFVVLFDALYPRKAVDDVADSDDKFDVIKDWDKLSGAHTADKVTKSIGIDEYIARQGA